MRVFRQVSHDGEHPVVTLQIPIIESQHFAYRVIIPEVFFRQGLGQHDRCVVGEGPVSVAGQNIEIIDTQDRRVGERDHVSEGLGPGAHHWLSVMQSGNSLEVAGKIILEHRFQRSGRVHDVDVISSLHYPAGLHSIKPIGVRPESVIAFFMLDEKCDQQRGRQTDDQSTDVKDGIEFAADDVPVRGHKVVLEHGQSFLALRSRL